MNRVLITLSTMIWVAGAGCGGSGQGPAGGSSGAGGAGVGGSGGDRSNGACCWVDQTCRESSADACTEIAGTFVDGQSCAEASCPAATVDDVRASAEALEVLIRKDYPLYIDAVSTIGREYWNLNDVDPRYTGELLGKGGAALETDSPFNLGTFAARYRVILQAAALIRTSESLDEVLSPEQRSAVAGYAKTLQAYQLLLVLNLQFSNGIIPVDAIDDPDPTQGFINFADSLQHIADLLDEAATLLVNGGSDFPFGLSAAMASFRRPPTFRQFNRALSARVRIYQGDKAGSISGIAGSFFNINGSFNTGPQHPYSIETRNPFYHEHDRDLYTVHPSFLSDADAGDLRVTGNTRAYVPGPDLFLPLVVDGLIGDRQVAFVAFDTDPLPFLTNGELVLIYAEAQIGSDVNESLAAINRVRNAAGLGNYLGATDDASMLREVLKQRRYFLYGQGHRWIDLRRTGMLGQLPIDRAGDLVHPEFPRPTTEALRDIFGQ